MLTDTVASKNNSAASREWNTTIPQHWESFHSQPMEPKSDHSTIGLDMSSTTTNGFVQHLLIAPAPFDIVPTTSIMVGANMTDTADVAGNDNAILANTFTVFLNKAVTLNLSVDELNALQQEFADWFPGPVLLQPGSKVKLKPRYLLHGKDYSNYAAKVRQHSSDDPRIVTVDLGDGRTRHSRCCFQFWSFRFRCTGIKKGCKKRLTICFLLHWQQVVALQSQ